MPSPIICFTPAGKQYLCHHVDGCTYYDHVRVDEASIITLSRFQMAPTNESREMDDHEDDEGALIYRESQLRKAEAVAVERKSAASTHHRTSSRKKIQDLSHDSLVLR